VRYVLQDVQEASQIVPLPLLGWQEILKSMWSWVSCNHDIAQDPTLIVLGDWLSEMTMTVHGSGKVKNIDNSNGKVQLPLEERKRNAMYAETFLQCFEPAIPNLVKNKTKLAVNAGASDTELLAEVVVDLLERQGAGHLKVAWIEGDDVTSQVFKLIKEGETFESLMHGKRLEDWGMEPICAQAYLGGLCIAEAFREGADIVLAGRVADAAPVIGAAA
jgi:DNA-binding ferritin-like protein (Dps family)